MGPTCRRVRSSKDRPIRALAVTRLLSASRRTVAPGDCMRSEQSGQQSALRSSAWIRALGKAVLKAAICLGLCASEELRFACIIRSGSKLVSVYQLTLPLVAACSCACVIRLSRAHCKTTRSTAKATNVLHTSSHITTRHMASHENTAQGRRNTGTESSHLMFLEQLHCTLLRSLRECAVARRS